MKRKWAILLAMLAAIGVGAFFFARPGEAPSGQPPLVKVTTSARADFQSEFNRESGKLRIILLLSPT